MESDDEFERSADYTLKVLLTGEAGVGKTCILTRYVDAIFSDSYVFTVGVDFKARDLEVDGKIIRLNIWDLSGQERFRAAVNKFHTGTNGILLVFDITDMESFQNLQKRISDGEMRPNSASKILIGNKCDMEYKRQVPYDMAQEYANQLGIPYLETSAKYGTNVDQAFLELLSGMKSFLP
ncbi:hypothetical protein ACF0H5_002930 [Mactra antiquata]